MRNIIKLNRINLYPEEWKKPFFKPVVNQQLSAKAANSAFWAFLEKLSYRGIQLAATAVAARILVPEDFGLVGMATLVMGLIGLFKDYGLTTSIIYKKRIDQIDLSTAFWVNIIVGVGLFLIMFLASPLAAAYFSNEKITGVVKLLSLNFVLTSIGGVNGTILIKSIRFKHLAIINIVSSVLQAITTLSLILFFEAGYWGIICGMLSYSATDSILKIATTKWIPKAVFDIERLKSMFNYGKNIFFQKILNYFSANIDYLIIGRLLGATSLGIYQFAYIVPHLILNEISQTITKVLFPIFCQVQDNHNLFKEGYLKTVQYISIISFPSMIGMFFTAEQFIYLIFGNKYMAAVLPMQILCFSGMARSILHTMGVVFNSKGRPDIGLKWNLCLFPVVVIAVYIGGQYNLEGVAAAVTTTSYLSFIGAYLAIRLARISFFDYLRALTPAFIGSLVMLAGLWCLNSIILATANFIMAVEFGLSVIFGILIYVLYFTIFNKKLVINIYGLIKSGFK
jgi:PST family polysaccharide transporter